MHNPRIIARMDIKSNNLIKGVHLEGLRVIGPVTLYAKNYYNEGVDELIYFDSVASLYDRTYLVDIIKETARNIFIPLTVGGAIKTVQDVENILLAGADKIAINTAAVKNPHIINDIAKTYGSQCMILQIDAKSTPTGFEVYIDGGREKTGIDVFEWIKQAQKLGCGEIVLTSIDQDGTKKGFDIKLITSAASLANVPLTISGGFGNLSHLDAIKDLAVDAIAIGSAFHYNLCSVHNVRNFLNSNGN